MTLFEHFNTSNQTSPRFERHENFVIELKSPGCSLTQTFDYDDRCQFVQKTEECREYVLLFDYTDIFYCQMDPHNVYSQFGCVLLLGFIGYLFMGFAATTTEEFFCPALKVVTHSLGISENLAGITLLAFGNSAPDLVSSLSSANEEISTIYSDSVGSAMFITSFVAGIIITMGPFHVEPTAFVRDLAFHVLAILYINYAIKSGRNVSLDESIVMLSIYPAYFLIIMIDQYLLVITLRNLTNKLKDQRTLSEVDAERLKDLRVEAGIEITVKIKTQAIELGTEEGFHGTHANDKLFRQLINSLNPIELDEWKEASRCKKIFMASRCPIAIILLILLPIVDFDREISGWSKLLNCIQTPLLPAVLLFLNGSGALVFGYQLWALSFFFTVPIAILMFISTRTDTAPRCHLFFGCATVVASIVLIRVFTRELINIIDLFGIVTYRSLSFLGCTITSFGDGLGDLLASIELARQGYQKMGLAACIAGPLFYLTVGLGSIFLYKSIIFEGRSYTATQGSMGENCTIFLLATLIGMLLSGVVTNFQLRRSIGYFLVILYGIFNLYCLLGEFQVIHPFGTDHSEDYGAADL